jgi:hypothetical protein
MACPANIADDPHLIADVLTSLSSTPCHCDRSLGKMEYRAQHNPEPIGGVPLETNAGDENSGVSFR